MRLAPEERPKLQEGCRISLFGSLRIEQNGRTLTRFRTQKTASLLAFLAFHRTPQHTREELAERLWPDSAPRDGRNSLNMAVSSLRHQLEPPGIPAGTVLLADRYCVHLNPSGVTTDSAEFERLLQVAREAVSSQERALLLEQAVTLHSAPLLTGLYDDWIVPEQLRLTEACLDALRGLADYWQAEGQQNRALEYARRAATLDPFSETACTSVLRLLHQIGQDEAAARHYQDFAQRLRTQWNETPSGALQREVRGWLQERVTAPPRQPVPSASPIEFGPAAGTLTALLLEFSPSCDVGQNHTIIRTGRAHGARVLRQEPAETTLLFSRATDAAHCLAALRQKPLERLLRAAMDTCEVREKEGSSPACVLRMAARLLLAAPNGQTLCSETTARLLERDMPQGWSLRAAGPYKLPEVETPQTLFFLLPDGAPAPETPIRVLPLYGASSPRPLARLWGRDEDLSRLTHLLTPDSDARTRLVTVTGIGGQGKTRLALEAMEALRRAYGGAVWFVPMADMLDARSIPESLRDALRLPMVPGRSLLEQVVAFLRDQCALLVLDNFEQIVEEGAATAADLLHQCPGLRLLITSRHTLRIAGEQEMPLAPLAIPTEGSSLAEMADCGSVALFLDRAQAVRPDFALTARSAPVIAEICRRLEGVPLSLELTAARAQMLTPTQMLEQLEDRFRFLVSRQRGVVARHRSLHAALEWSYRLLTPTLRELLACVSLFRGGWTVEAASAVFDDLEIEEALFQLRDASLVSLEPMESAARFGMLETVRAFAAEQRPPERETLWRERHATWTMALAEAAEAHLQGPEQTCWLDRLSLELDNLRAALEWTIQTPEQTETALRLAAALWRFWETRGYMQEGRTWLETALRRGIGVSPPVRARALSAAGLMARNQGDFDAAQTWFEQALELNTRLDDPQGQVNLLHNLAGLAYGRGELVRARACWEQVLPLRLRDEVGYAATLYNLGCVACDQGDYAEAAQWHQDSLAVKRRLNDTRGIALSLTGLGIMAANQGDYAAARIWHEEGLALKRTLNDDVSVAYTLFALASIAHDEDRSDEAERYLEEALALFRRHGDRRGAAYCVAQLGEVAAQREQIEAAEARYGESLQMAREMRDQELIARIQVRWGLTRGSVGDLPQMRALIMEAFARFVEADEKRGILESLEALARAARDSGQFDLSARFYSAADVLRAQLACPPAPCHRAAREALRNDLQNALGIGFQAAYDSGQTLSVSEAFALARDAWTQSL